MKMSELIARYGDDDVRFQKLDDCADAMNMGKKATKITFSTDQRIDIKGTEQLGLILWFDREKLAEAVAALKLKPTDGAAPEPQKVRHPNPPRRTA